MDIFYITCIICIIYVIMFIISFESGSVEHFVKSIVCQKEKLPPLEKREMKDAILTRPTLNHTPIRTQKIPKIIIQTNEYNKIPKEMYNATLTILRDNPDYSYYYFDDLSSRKFIKDSYPRRIVDAYDKLIPGAFKSDLFRYCILNLWGGVYIDMGMISKTPLDSFIEPSDEFISPDDNHTGGLYNAFICTIPGHPIVKKALEMAVKNIESGFYGKHPLEITGPALFAKAFQNVTKQIVKPGLVLPGGIKTISYQRKEFCTTGGDIFDPEKGLILKTRYPEYHIDRLWYNTKKHYTDIWREKKVYKK
jgi:mannosyltransferase OCH1-like enzyme